jgi:hypothetical protein
LLFANGCFAGGWLGMGEIPVLSFRGQNQLGLQTTLFKALAL